MSQFSYTDYSNNKPAQSSSNVGFFPTLKVGEQLFVRFPYVSSQDIKIISAHEVSVDGLNFYPKVSCLRKDPYRDPAQLCPICANGGTFYKTIGNNTVQVDSKKFKNIFIVKMLMYKADDSGKLVPTPITWERPAAFATDISNLINLYGDLRDYVFVISRSGEGRDTRYTITAAPNNERFSEANFPKAFELFDGFDEASRVWDKSYDDCVTFVNTGSFPMHNSNGDAQDTAKDAPVNDTTYTRAPVTGNFTIDDAVPSLDHDVPFDDYDETVARRNVAPWEATPAQQSGVRRY